MPFYQYVIEVALYDPDAGEDEEIWTPVVVHVVADILFASDFDNLREDIVAYVRQRFPRVGRLTGRCRRVRVITEEEFRASRHLQVIF
jgi:hypothetical protein